MKICISPLLSVSILLSALSSIHAAESFWTNNAGGTFSAAGNWSAGVPGPADNARFTNDAGYTVNWSANATNANAFFTGNPTATRTIVQNIGSSTWLLTNSFVIDSQSGNTIRIDHQTGTLVVTNADGTASLVVGQNPTGFEWYRIDGGSVIVDRLLATNGPSSSFVDMHNGTLTTLNGSLINWAGNIFPIDGQQNDYLMTWNVLGGSNAITASQVTVGNNGGTHGVVLVKGPNTVWDISNTLLLGNNTARGDLTVTNGARVTTGNTMFLGFGGGDVAIPNATATVTGSNSVLSVGGHLYVGYLKSTNSQLTIANGAQVWNVIGAIGNIVSASNSVLVTGSGSTWSNSIDIQVGVSGVGNQLVVSNGGRAISAQGIKVGALVDGAGSVVVTGPGSFLQSTHGLIGLLVGTNGPSTTFNTQGNGSVLLTDGGMYEGPAIVSGFNNSGNITNAGGVFQFIVPNPTITANTANSIVLTNGTISFRAINNATPTGLAGITYRGNNTLRLNNSSNATGLATYTFDSVANTGNPTNYQKLSLMNGSTWRSTTLTIGSGGALVGNGTVAANVTNLGTIAPGFSAGQLTFTSNLVLGATSRLEMEIGGTNGIDYDQLIVGGNVAVTGTLAIAMIDSFSPTPGDTFTLIDNQGANPISGFFTGLTNNSFLDASANGIDAYFTIHYDGGTGNDLVLLATIPEPSAVLLSALAAASLLRFRKNRK